MTQSVGSWGGKSGAGMSSYSVYKTVIQNKFVKIIVKQQN
jgi:hypothetical protein